jgi:hypothetical protein
MRLASATAAAALVLVLAGCAPTVALEPAADAASPLCAEVSVRLPDTIGELAVRQTNAQATAAWGEPTAIILRCGVPAPAPTAELPCVTVEGVDWLRDDADAPVYVFTTYGREPAVEVIVQDGETTSGLEALTEVADAVSRLPVTGECIVPE